MSLVIRPIVEKVYVAATVSLFYLPDILFTAHSDLLILDTNLIWKLGLSKLDERVSLCAKTVRDQHLIEHVEQFAFPDNRSLELAIDIEGVALR